MTDLKPDCARCFALCCVALPFTASADFAVSKPAGRPCTNLGPDFGCRIHGRLRGEGFTGCTVYECDGAGQRVSQETFGGRDWRRHPELAAPMFAVFPVVRQLHELLRFLEEALTLDPQPRLAAELRTALAQVERLAGGTAEELGSVDVAAQRAAVGPLLARASEQARASVPGHKANRRGADLIGARLAGADLRGANLRGAYLIGAVLTRADLRQADLTGADLRDADLSGADLSGALFLTQAQLTSARGDAATRLPAGLAAPAHWTRAGAVSGRRRRS